MTGIPQARRITVTLSPEASKILDDLGRRIGQRRPACIERVLKLYDLLHDNSDDGHVTVVSSSENRVRIKL